MTIPFYPAQEQQLVIPAALKLEMMKLDVSSFVKQKQKLDYLSWAVVERLLWEHFPDLEVRYHFTMSLDGTPVFRLGEDGSGYILPYLYNTKTGQYTSPIFFPIYDLKFGDADPESAAAVNKSMQRAAAKLVAVATGIGFNLYARIEEDLPSEGATPDPHVGTPTAKRTSFKKRTGGIS